MHDHDAVAPLAYTAEQAARALNISRSSVYALLADGTIKSSFIAGRRLISVAELHALLRAEPTPEELATLCEAIRWHDAGQVGDDLTTSCCWASDRIELRRVGIEPARWGFCGLTWPVAQRILSRGRAVKGAGETW